MRTQDKSTATQKETDWELADKISGIAGYAQSMVSIMFDQAQSSDPDKQAINKIVAALDSTNRYLKDIRNLCEEAQKGGA